MTTTIIALTAFALLCLACALFFAVDWYRMREQRDWHKMQAEAWEQLWRRDWQDFHKLRAEAQWWQDFAAPDMALDPPRDPKSGRFVKRAK